MNGEGFAMILVETIEHFAANRRQTFARMSSPFDYSASSVGEAVGTVMQAGRVDVTPGTPVHLILRFPRR